MKKIIRISAILLVLVLTVGSFAACSSLLPQNKQLIGKWVDSSALNSGYEFFDDGKVAITYANFNIPIINQTFDGKIDGIYSTEKVDGKNMLTLSYTVLLQSIEKTYEYSVKDGVLTITDPDNGNQTFFTKGEISSTS